MDAVVVSAIAAAISSLAALLSLLFAGFALYLQWTGGRPSLSLEIRSAFVLGGLGARKEPMLEIEARNRGRVRVVVASAGFTVAGGGRLGLMGGHDILGRQVLPAPLEPGDSVSVAADIRDIATKHVSGPRVTGAYVNTSGGDRFTCGIKNGGRWLESWAARAGPD